MSLLELARTQFAMTTIFHFFFVPLSIGMGLMVALMETLYVVKNKEIYKDMAKFWMHIFLLSFAVGVVTGIIQEFQFGMNWSAYSRFVGDIFGAPLAVEALAAFFLESTFLGLWMFGWDRFSKKIHLVFVWLVVLGSTLSAFWIIVANAFMQHPSGYAYNAKTGRAELDSFADLLKNHQLWLEFPHVMFGAFCTGAFVVAGLSAFQLMKKRHIEFYKKSMFLGLIVGLLSAGLAVGWGDVQTQALVKDQPMKFAAAEGIAKKTGDPAAWAIISNFDSKTKENKWSLDVPYVLSILGNHSLSGSFEGMDTINKELEEKYGNKLNANIKNFYLPVNTIFYSFRVMAIFGGAMLGVAVLGLALFKIKLFGRKIEQQKWFLWIAGLMTFAPFLANTGGWLVTELGRYPWTVYGLFTIADSVSPNVSVGSLLFTNIVFFLLFALLGGVMVYLVIREMKHGPYHEVEHAQESLDPFEKGAF